MKPFMLFIYIYIRFHPSPSHFPTSGARIYPLRCTSFVRQADFRRSTFAIAQSSGEHPNPKISTEPLEILSGSCECRKHHFTGQIEFCLSLKKKKKGCSLQPISQVFYQQPVFLKASGINCPQCSGREVSIKRVCFKQVRIEGNCFFRVGSFGQCCGRLCCISVSESCNVFPFMCQVDFNHTVNLAEMSLLSSTQ